MMLHRLGGPTNLLCFLSNRIEQIVRQSALTTQVCLSANSSTDEIIIVPLSKPSKV